MTYGTAGHGRKSLAKIRDETVFYPHQIDGIRRMSQMTSFLLADEMGLGKSLQALTVAAVDFERGWANRVLVVAPASLKWNWLEEIEKHTHFSAVVLDGSPKARDQILDAFEVASADILIINYEQLVGSKSHLEAINKIGFDIAIFDEAHYIKNPKAHRTKACHKLKLKRAFVLTGSPMLNQANDLWGLLHRVDPAAFPRYWSFVNRYCVFGGYKEKQIVGPKNRTELNTVVQGVMIRRLKSDELDLPEKLHVPVLVGFHPTQEKLYKQAEDELKIDIPDNPTAMEIENVLTKMLRLKQICGTPHTIGGPDESLKLDKAMEMLTELLADDEDSPPEHVVVFTQFRGVLEAMQNRLEEANADPKNPLNAPVFILHGDVPMNERQAIVRAWEDRGSDGKPGKPGILLAMIQVAGVGLNMTASKTAIFLDKLWTPKLNEQAEDRMHRIGADKSRGVIQIYNIIVAKSVEQRVEAILKAKTKTFNDVVEESEWKKRLMAELQDDESTDTDDPEE